jgi:hypothetical protein
LNMMKLKLPLRQTRIILLFSFYCYLHSFLYTVKFDEGFGRVPSQKGIPAPPYRTKVPLEVFRYSLQIQSSSSLVQEIIVVKISSISINFTFIWGLCYLVIDFIQSNCI